MEIRAWGLEGWVLHLGFGGVSVHYLPQNNTAFLRLSEESKQSTALKKLRQPSERLPGDTARVGWTCSKESHPPTWSVM